jgi:hypothetical protein
LGSNVFSSYVESDNNGGGVAVVAVAVIFMSEQNAWFLEVQSRILLLMPDECAQMKNSLLY